MTASATLSQGYVLPDVSRPDRRRGDERRSLILHSAGCGVSSLFALLVDRRGPVGAIPVGRDHPAPLHSLGGKADHTAGQIADALEFRPGRRAISAIALVTLASVHLASRKFGLLTTGRDVRGLIPRVMGSPAMAVHVVFRFSGAVTQTFQFHLRKLVDGASAIVLSFHRAVFHSLFDKAKGSTGWKAWRTRNQTTRYTK